MTTRVMVEVAGHEITVIETDGDTKTESKLAVGTPPTTYYIWGTKTLLVTETQPAAEAPAEPAEFQDTTSDESLAEQRTSSEA